MAIKFLEARRIRKEFRYIIWTDITKKIGDDPDPKYVITLIYPAKPDDEYHKSLLADILVKVQQHNMEVGSEEEILPEEGTEMLIPSTTNILASTVNMLIGRRQK